MGIDPNHSFYVGLILVFNVSVSFSLCLTVQFLSVAYPTYSSNITRCLGVSIFLFFHIVGTIVFSAIAVIMEKHALTQTALNSLADRDLPELAGFIQGKVLFGFAPESPRLLSGAAASWLLFISTWWVLMVVIGIVTVVRETRNSMLQKTHKMRRIVGTILVIRTAIPICTLSIPGLIVSLLVFFQTPNAAGLVSVICVVAASSGGLMCIPSIVILKPYRVVFLRLLCVPQIRRALNMSSVHSSSNASPPLISATISSLQIPSETRRLPPIRSPNLGVEKDKPGTEVDLP
ncbi:hypothetical protein AAVH_26739 [Aphelenchoides avenae]|nr:hypothetical protein AAVH_26739 [Aphelenchus avenae]